MRTESHTTTTPYRGGFVTGTSPACSLLIPRLCPGKIHCPFGLGGMSSGTTGCTIGRYRFVKSLAGLPIFKEFDPESFLGGTKVDRFGCTHGTIRPSPVL
jgi:hypothetical protein